MKNNQKKQSLLLIEINECDFDYFLYGAKKYNYPAIRKFIISKKKFKTYTDDNKEGYNLDPWVQWVSVHTGKKSKFHKIYRIGQTLNKNVNQLWDILSKNNISCSVWGAFNATLNSRKNIKIFFPDPWSYNEKAYPGEFKNYLELPAYYSQNYPNVNFFNLAYKGMLFLKEIIFSKNIIYFFNNFFQFAKIFYKGKLKSLNLYFFLDLASLLVMNECLKKKQYKSNFSIIALNSFAHYQHNYWDIKDYEKIYFWFLNEKIKLFNQIKKQYRATIVYNGFSQYKINPIYSLRPKNPNNFIKNLSIKFIKLNQNMTTGATVFFKNNKEKKDAIKILSDFKIYNYPVFFVQDYKAEKKIFYKIALESKKNSINFSKINKKNYKNFFVLANGKKTKEIKISNKNELQKIFDNFLYTKSTSKHLRNGQGFSEGISFPKSKFKNEFIFKYVLNYFDVKY